LTSHYFWDNNYGAQIVCEDLGYGKGVTQKGKRNQFNRESFDTETGYRRCASGNQDILQCRKYGGPNQRDLSAQAFVRCSGTPYKHKIGKTGTEFRISGNSDGWVHRKGKDGKWRPLTSHYFWDNNYGAQIVCRDIGFGTGTRTKTRNNGNRDNFDTETGNRRCAANNNNIL
jgi:hypothetical protein